MAGTVTKSLYLSIGGDVTTLTTAAKAGKSVLLSLGDAAVDVQAEVKRAFADMGDSIPDQAKRIERSFTDTFATIRRNAQSVLDAPTGHAAIQVINVNAANDAAKAAENQAVALRQVATAAATVAERAGAAGAAERVLAVASAAVAERAEEEAAALRKQASLLGLVDAEYRTSAGGIVDSGEKVAGAHGRMSTSGAILQHVVRSTTDSYAAGLPVSIIFAEQISRLGEAAAYAAQEGGQTAGAFAKFGAVMSGPWGLAITIGISLAAQLIGKLIESHDAIAEESKKLEENAKEAEAASIAKRAFATTEAGLHDSVRALTEDLRKQNDELRTNAELLNIKAKTDVAGLQKVRADLSKQLASARAAAAVAASTPTGGVAGTAAVVQGQADSKVADLKERLAANASDIKAANAALLETQRNLSVEQGKRLADPLEEIKRKYEGEDGLIEQARRHATAEEVINGILTRRVALLAKQQRAETEAEQKRQSDAQKAAPALGKQLESEQAATLLKSAQGFTGLSERTSSGRAGLQDLFSQAGVHIDPAMTAWCAAFVNAVLATNGLKGTGSLSARSFLNYGSATDKPDKGDIVVLKRGTGSEGHVGFFAGTDAKGRVLVTGGNQGDQVSTESFARSNVLGFRRPPTASEAERSAAAAARRSHAEGVKTADDDRAFTNADRQADDAIAKAKLQLGGTIDDEYRLRLQQIAADLESKNHAIEDQVTAGKLTRAQAYELEIKNAQLAELEERSATEKRRVALADAAYEADRDDRAGRIALLEVDAQLARTRKDRVALERKALEERQAQERLDADHRLIVAPTGSTEQARAAAAVQRLPAQQKAEQSAFDDQHLDALGSYKKQLDDNVHDMNSALKGVEVDGLRGIEDGFAGIISGTESVSQAFGRMAETILADLARIAIEKAVLSVLGFSKGGEVGSVTPERHAAGGFITGKGSGTSDDILSWLSNGEFVMTAAATRRHLPMLKAMNDNRLPAFATGGLVGDMPAVPTGYPSLPRADQLRVGGGGTPFNIDMRHAVMVPELVAQLQAFAIATGGQARTDSIAYTNDAFRLAARQGISR